MKLLPLLSLNHTTGKDKFSKQLIVLVSWFKIDTYAWNGRFKK